MELNPETLQFLSQCFANTLSLNAQSRREAESALVNAAEQPNYGLVLLHIVAEPSVDEQIRQAAAVYFKNHIKARWSPSPVSESNPIPLNPISGLEKENIKTLIVSLMLQAGRRIQSQLSEALSLIGEHDFPRAWPSLLPEIVAHLDTSSQSNDYVSINGLLATLDSLFMKFRYTYKTNDLLLDLKYCLDNFAKPLLEIFKRTANLIDQLVASGAANASTLKPYFESQKLCCSIFYSLNFQELPEFFEDHMSEWMVEFKKYLTVKYPALEDPAGNELVLFELRAAVCDNITLYMVKEEELFQGYLSGFVEAVWSLLVSTSSHGWEQLTVTAIKFLTTVSKSGHHSLFSRDDILQQICQSIVIPNVILQDEDEELFEMNPVEFIRRDMEGSDIDTRRRIACELLKGIAINYKDKVTEKVTAQIRNCLDLFGKDPKNNWKYKDCAIYLVVSLATRNAGGTLVSTDIVDVEGFFGAVIVPELQNQDVTSFPMLKAGALKFFTLFRNQIAKHLALTLLLDVTRFLTSTDYVVHSYAASCIEKLLLVKDDGARARYTSADIGPILGMLMTNLFGALSNPESEENQYVMKCIMRVVCVADLTSAVASPCIEGLTTILGRVCQNPKNPLFNHYLFESIAALIRRACEKDISLLSLFETKLFPSLQMILARDISEFFPYAFQLLAELVDLNRPPLPEYYLQVFDILLLPDTWTRSANVPALVSLLKAFLQKAPHELNQQGRLSSVLGIFNKLVSTSSTEDQGFYVLNTVIENLGFEVISPYITHIWVSLFNRLQNKKTVKFVKNLIIFMSLFLVKHGSQNLVNSVNTVQPNVFQAILEQFWIPNLKFITGPIELKLASVASTRLICESPDLLDIRLWGKMLDSIVTLLSQPEQARIDEEPEIPEFGETAGYNTTFSRLYNAGKKEEDPLKELKDPRQFLVMSLSNLSAASQGKYPQVISANLDNGNQTALLQLCNSYSVSIV